MRLKKIHSLFVRIFDAPPGERSERDIRSVLPVVMMKTTCFRNLDADAVTYILQRATLERYKLDEVIVRQGEVGDKFYIILDGTVSIYVDAKKDEKVLRTMTEDNVMFPLPPPRRMSVATAISDRDGGEDLTVERHEIRGPHSTSSRKSRRESAQFGLRPQSRRHSSHGSHGSHERVDHDKKDEDKDKRHRKKYGMAVNTLGRYQNFGELALIYPNRQRNASVIAEERTEVLVISYEIFEATLQDTLEQDLDEKRLFIQTHPFFSKWSFQMQRQLQWSLVRSTHSIGDPVIKQGSKLAGLCFLVSGRAHLAGEPMRHMVQFPDFFVKEKRDVFQKGEPEPLRREETTLSQMVDHMRGSKSHRNLLAGMEPLTYIRRTDGYAAAEKVVHEKMVDICIIEEGEVISDFELLLGLEMNMFSVVCQTACTFFHLESKIFDRLIYKRSPHTLTMIKFLAERKLTRRIRSQQGQRMPILAPLLLKILDVRVVDPSEENKEGSEKLALPTAKTIMLPKTPMAQRQPKRSKTVLFDWFVQGKTPLLQPIDKDAIYYREMIQKRAQTREMLRKRNDQQEVKSLGRRIRDTYWFNLKEKKKAMNTMKRLKLEHSEVTQAERWK